jgi:hypothetical protein
MGAEHDTLTEKSLAKLKRHGFLADQNAAESLN